MVRPIEDCLTEMADQGFTIVPGVFQPAQVERMRAAVDEVFAREEGHLEEHGAKVRFSINLTNDHKSFVRSCPTPS